MGSYNTRDAKQSAGLDSGLCHKEKIKHDSSGSNDPKTQKPNSPPTIPARDGHKIR